MSEGALFSSQESIPPLCFWPDCETTKHFRISQGNRSDFEVCLDVKLSRRAKSNRFLEKEGIKNLVPTGRLGVT